MERFLQFSRQEAMDKQTKFVAVVQKFQISLLSEQITNDVSELIFEYKMTTKNDQTNEFIGKHLLTWNNQKIIKEEFNVIHQVRVILSEELD